MQFLRKNIFIIVLLIGVIYQVICAIHGIDLSDEGFVMTLYRDFMDGFEARRAGAGYPLSCYFGWCLYQIFPDCLLAMRLCGILMITIMEITIYVYLKDKINREFLALGLLTMSFVMGGDPKPLGHNNITAVIATLSLISILEGSLKTRYLLLLMGGLLIGVNTFVRLPNVLEVSFAIIPFIAGYSSRGNIITKNAVKQITTIIVGFLLGGIFSWMWLMHIGADANVIEFIKNIGVQLNGDSTHSSLSMLLKIFANYAMSIGYLCIYLGAITFVSRIYDREKYIMLFVSLLTMCIFGCTIYFGGRYLGWHIFATLNGVSLFGGIVFAIWGNRTQRTIALGAVLMSLVLPLGSDQGFMTMWTGSWLSFPVGLAATPVFYTKFRTLASGGQYNVATYLAALTIAVSVGLRVYSNCYYEPGCRHLKTATIDSKFTAGIYTTKEKAKCINPLLSELRRYVSRGDTMLVYDWSPMLYCLTYTKPYAGISWPCLFYGRTWVDMIHKKESMSTNLPVVVLQNYWYLDSVRNDYYDPNRANDGSQKVMIECINDFIRRNRYQLKWSNNWYEIYLPPKKI